jgi:glyoxylase-like metal-dependent hydrolase (beta-lactamase superfamily II)
LEFNRNHRFRYAAVETVAVDLQRVTARNPGPMTFHGTGSYLLGGRDAVLIDPGPPLPEHEQALCAALYGRRLQWILVTHRHQDHAGLARRLGGRLDAPIAAHDGRRQAHTVAVGSETGEAGFVPDRRLVDGDLLDTAAGTLEVVHTPGHTGDHLCFVDHSRRRVFCGDHVMAWSTSVIIPPDGHVGRYLESLERLRRFADYTFWPTHGPPIEQAENWLDALIEHRRRRQVQVLDALGAGPADAENLLHRIYGSLSPALMAAARQSLLAGLAYLVELGQVVAPERPGEDYRLEDGATGSTSNGRS